MAQYDAKKAESDLEKHVSDIIGTSERLEQDDMEGVDDKEWEVSRGWRAEILALKHESRILGQWSNPVSGSSRNSQSSSPWAKQHRV